MCAGGWRYGVANVCQFWNEGRDRLHAASAWLTVNDSSPARANTVTIFAGQLLGSMVPVSAPTDLASGSIGGYFNPILLGSNPATTAGLQGAALTPIAATGFSLANYNPSTEAAALDTILGTPGLFTTGSQTACSVSCGAVSLLIDTVYFSLKVATFEAFFKNLTGGPITVRFSDTSVLHGFALNHYTEFGSLAAVPLPPAILLFAGALAGMGFLAWQRRGKQASRPA